MSFDKLKHNGQCPRSHIQFASTKIVVDIVEILKFGDIEDILWDWISPTDYKYGHWYLYFWLDHFNKLLKYLKLRHG